MSLLNRRRALRTLLRERTQMIVVTGMRLNAADQRIVEKDHLHREQSVDHDQVDQKLG